MSTRKRNDLLICKSSSSERQLCQRKWTFLGWERPGRTAKAHSPKDVPQVWHALRPVRQSVGEHVVLPSVSSGGLLVRVVGPAWRPGDDRPSEGSDGCHARHCGSRRAAVSKVDKMSKKAAEWVRTCPEVRVRDPVVLRLDRLEERNGVVQSGVYPQEIRLILRLHVAGREGG